MLDIGEVFAGFTIERMLGQGGMGTVYLARHPRLDRLTALKLLNRDLFADERVRARFEREADLAAGLDHPGIVTVFDRGTEGEQLWISMQYVDGIDAATVDPMTLPPERAVQIVEGVADALDYAHSRGVLHRDVKPANILLARSGGGQGERMFLTDFGIARLRADSTHLTQQGMFTATLAYASPEQMTGAELDHRSDQYSLACALYWLFTGIAPFDSPDPNEIIRGTLYLNPPPLALRRQGLPPALDAVLAAAMAKHPAARFDSCAAFAKAARQALTSNTPPALPRPPANTPAFYPPAPVGPYPPHAPGYGPNPAQPIPPAPQSPWRPPHQAPVPAAPRAPGPPPAGYAAPAAQPPVAQQGAQPPAVEPPVAYPVPSGQPAPQPPVAQQSPARQQSAQPPGAPPSPVAPQVPVVRQGARSPAAEPPVAYPAPGVQPAPQPPVAPQPSAAEPPVAYPVPEVRQAAHEPVGQPGSAVGSDFPAVDPQAVRSPGSPAPIANPVAERPHSSQPPTGAIPAVPQAPAIPPTDVPAPGPRPQGGSTGAQSPVAAGSSGGVGSEGARITPGAESDLRPREEGPDGSSVSAVPGGIAGPAAGLWAGDSVAGSVTGGGAPSADVKGGKAEGSGSRGSGSDADSVVTDVVPMPDTDQLDAANASALTEVTPIARPAEEAGRSAESSGAPADSGHPARGVGSGVAAAEPVQGAQGPPHAAAAVPAEPDGDRGAAYGSNPGRDDSPQRGVAPSDATAAAGGPSAAEGVASGGAPSAEAGRSVSVADGFGTTAGPEPGQQDSRRPGAPSDESASRAPAAHPVPAADERNAAVGAALVQGGPSQHGLATGGEPGSVIGPHAGQAGAQGGGVPQDSPPPGSSPQAGGALAGTPQGGVPGGPAMGAPGMGGPWVGPRRPVPRRMSRVHRLGWLLLAALVFALVGLLVALVVVVLPDGDEAADAAGGTAKGPSSSVAAVGDSFAASRRVFPTLVPQGSVAEGPGYRGARCVAVRAVSELEWKEPALQWNPISAGWQCERTDNNAGSVSYLVLEYPTAAQARSVVEAMPAAVRYPGTKNGVPFSLRRWVVPDQAGVRTQTAHQVMSFPDDSTRANYLIAVSRRGSSGVAGAPRPTAQDEVIAWWEEVPL
ncbi:protein kinase [Nocardia sp. NPDC087230]|uniref:protein kinase domain-containing protein n=1 Tax=Nocardia sp. NPDC087230 TaxID=3364331 RepID=UPI003828AF61